MRGSKFVQSVLVASILGAFSGGAALAGEPDPVKTPAVKIDKAAASKLTVNKNGKLLKQTKFGKQIQTKKPGVTPPVPAPDPAHKP